MKQIDLKDQYFGTEIEMTGISRYDAAVAIGRMFGTEPYHIRSYDSWCVKDSDGKTWKFSRDSSIDCERLANGTVIDADGDYSTEMVSPKLEYSEMGETPGSGAVCQKRRCFCQFILWHACPCGRIQSYTKESEKCTDDHVLQRGYSVQSLKCTDEKGR